jgi:cell division protease FtsH
VEYAAARPGVISQLLVGWVLPILIVVGLWSFFARRLNPAGESIFSIGKSRARLVAYPDTGVTFDDVAGADEAKFELKEVVDFLTNPKQYENIGARIPRSSRLHHAAAQTILHAKILKEVRRAPQKPGRAANP